MAVTSSLFPLRLCFPIHIMGRVEITLTWGGLCEVVEYTAPLCLRELWEIVSEPSENIILC